ncbi:MAG: hypothetical protein KA408_14515 [Flavobacteriales bacterium]|nr:hypothetical protein [Flavobacteriales bacterium]
MKQNTKRNGSRSMIYGLIGVAMLAPQYQVAAQHHDLVMQHHALITDRSTSLPNIETKASSMELAVDANELIYTFRTNTPTALKVELLDSANHTLQERMTWTRAGRNFVPIDISALPAGIYVVRVGGHVHRFKRNVDWYNRTIEQKR